MANVYLAEDEDLGRRVAIKILNERYANDELFVERFRREAKSAAAPLPSEHRLDLRPRRGRGHLLHRDGGHRGPSLEGADPDERPPAPRQAIDYTRQILAALRFAHRHGIIHRDIKPHNILLGAEERLKVTDFGIARAGASQMTEAGSIMGTAQYLSPEQARGAPVAAASDLYSVGVVLYEMLTGEVPFNGDTAVEIAMKHLNEAPRPPSARAPGIPADLDRIVMRALAKDPEDRYRTAEEIGLRPRPRRGRAADRAARRRTPRPPCSPAYRRDGRDAGAATAARRRPPRRGGGRRLTTRYARPPRRKRSCLPWLFVAPAPRRERGRRVVRLPADPRSELSESQPVAVPNVGRASRSASGAAARGRGLRGGRTSAQPSREVEQGRRHRAGSRGRGADREGRDGDDHRLERHTAGRGPRRRGLQLAGGDRSADRRRPRWRVAERLLRRRAEGRASRRIPGRRAGDGARRSTLRVSKGPEAVEVPDVIGLDQGRATDDPQGRRLPGSSVATFVGPPGAGIVVDQNPRGGTGRAGSDGRDQRLRAARRRRRSRTSSA